MIKKNVCEYILKNNFHFVLITTDKLGITNNQLVYIYITEFKILLIYVFIYLLIIIYLCDLYIILDIFKIKKKIRFVAYTHLIRFIVQNNDYILLCKFYVFNVLI